MTNGPKSQVYEFGEFRIDAAKRLLTKGGKVLIPLTPKVFDTLLYLVRNQGKVLEKDELMREIWKDSIVEENNLTQNISVLRRLLGEKPGEQFFIATVAGHGYRFVPRVSVGDASEGIVSKEQSAENSLRFQPPNPLLQKRRLVLSIAGLALLTFFGFGFYLWIVSRQPETVVKSVAVLPFKPLVLENHNEALELGMADALIAKLSGDEKIIVRPLSAVRRYSSVEQDAQTAGRELGVEIVLDGTIQNWGDRIRVSAKLLRSTDGKQLWAEQFDQRFTDIFAVQNIIADKVAAALKIPLIGNDKKHFTDNIEAYQLYTKGRYCIAKGTPTDLLASIPFFQQAVDLDPEYALAYTGLAHAYGVLGLTGDTTIKDVVAKARATEQKALELDDGLGQAHNTRCMGLFWYDWDFAAAERECRRAIDIDPNNGEFHGNYAAVLSSNGRHDEALAEARRCRELDPANLTQNALEGQFLLYAGRVDDALDQLKKTTELEPNFWMPHLIAAGAYIEKSMYVEAIAESKKEFELSGGNAIEFGVFALARSGKRAEAREDLNNLLRAPKTKYVSPYNIALIYNALDDRDKVFEWLEKGFAQRAPLMTFLKVEPKWNNLRSDPRFVDLIARMGLQL